MTPTEILARLEKRVDEHHKTRVDSTVMRIEVPMPLLIHELKLAIYESALIQAQLIVALAAPLIITATAVPEGFKPEPGSITYVKEPT